MEAKYNAAIKAGVIGGVFLIAYLILTTAIGLLVSVVSLVCMCISIPVIVIIAVGIGALAVKYVETVITKWVDVIIVSGLAGFIAGLIYGVVSVVLMLITPFLLVGISTLTGGSSTDINTQMMAGIFGMALFGPLSCICSVVWLFVITILAMIGGAIYGALKLKLT